MLLGWLIEPGVVVDLVTSLCDPCDVVLTLGPLSLRDVSDVGALRLLLLLNRLRP